MFLFYFSNLSNLSNLGDLSDHSDLSDLVVFTGVPKKKYNEKKHNKASSSPRPTQTIRH